MPVLLENNHSRHTYTNMHLCSNAVQICVNQTYDNHAHQYGNKNKNAVLQTNYKCGVCVKCGVWCLVFGVWCVVCGVWCVVCGVWCVVCGLCDVCGVLVMCV